MKPAISIVVPSRGRSAKLRRLLDLLDQQSIDATDRFEVVVSLDGDTAADHDLLSGGRPYCLRVLPLGPVGISGAKNAAVAQCAGQVLIFVNDDVEPAEDFVRHHAAAHRAGQSVVLGASPWKRFADQTVFDELISRTRMIFFYSQLQDAERYDYRHAWNLNLSVDRGLIAPLNGPFCELLRPVFYDDVEFAFRLIGNKAGVFYNARAFAPHNHRYGLRGYFEREALLGVMAGALYEVNPACFKAIFGRGIDELVDEARRVVESDQPDACRCLEQMVMAAGTCWTPSVDDALIGSLYAAHLPLKRRGFRRGLLAAADRPDVPWTRRATLAAEALYLDPVFATLRAQRGGAIAARQAQGHDEFDGPADVQRIPGTAAAREQDGLLPRRP